jgi:hypothetical protein
VNVAREAEQRLRAKKGELSVPYLTGVGLRPTLLGFVLDIIRDNLDGFQGSGPLFLGSEHLTGC